MKSHRAFARQNALGYWEGCIEYPCGTVSAVTNAKHTEGAALDIAQRMIEGADERWAVARRNAEWRRLHHLGRIRPGEAVPIANSLLDRSDPSNTGERPENRSERTT